MMKRQGILALLLAAVLVLGAGQAGAAEDKSGVFVVVTSPDAQTQTMAMVLSMQFVQQGASVQILLCGPGGDLGVKGTPQETMKPMGVTAQGLLTKLIGMDVKADVCALYLPNAGKSPDDLLDGVGAAKPPAIAEAMLAENTKLFTF